MENCMLVFEKIKDIRETKGFTQEEIANALEISPSGYSKIERGETRISIDRLQQIADILEVNIFDLIPNKEHNIIYELNGGYNNFQGNYYSGDKSQAEIEKLQLIIAHKDELLAQKDDELKTLKGILALLQEKLA
ncbi:helix-turn-helix domain-containing protein [Moraxella lacunata]|uniref:helix-turn-helix domain-containing protein n=1 Tax=Moraxella lacunata TaxID=477 RepID=UPI003EE2D5D1